MALCGASGYNEAGRGIQVSVFRVRGFPRLGTMAPNAVKHFLQEERRHTSTKRERVSFSAGSGFTRSRVVLI